MGTAIYSYAYETLNGTISALTSYGFDVEFEGNSFTVNETISVSGSEYQYLGVTINGDPVIFYPGNGITSFLSNSGSYSVGDQMPEWDEVDFTPCFLADTLITTPSGPVAVERLEIGDLVQTADGRSVPVKWVGRKTIGTVFVREADLPVRIEAGALGENSPSRALRVTADHAICLDGALVQAGAMVNGSTIRRMTAAELGASFTVFHVETEAHELILAEGIPVETFVDNVTRRRFHNYAEYEALYGEQDETIPELNMPRVKAARQLRKEIRWQLERRAVVLGSRLSAA
jgi:hypothetical protein